MFLVARDPFVLYAVFLGLKHGLVKSGYAKFMMLLGVITFFTTIIFGHGNIVVAVYGVRITFLYFPFVFICSRVLTLTDIYNVGRIFVLLIIPMFILNVVQFFSPQSSFVNIGVGGDEEGAGFGGAMGFFRPPGIFTFCEALAGYYSLAFSFLLFFLLNENAAKQVRLGRTFLTLCLIAFFAAIPVQISRTNFVRTTYILLFFSCVALQRKKYATMFLKIAIILVMALPIIAQSKDMGLFIEVFMTRFNGANETERGLGTSAINRTFGWLFRALNHNIPVFGYGEGTFTNVGLTILTGGTNSETSQYKGVADSVEMEWGRIICEDGIIMGFIILITRFSMALSLFIKSLRSLKRHSNLLAWMTMPMSIYALGLFQLKMAYNLGFMCIIVISCLVALRNKPQ